MKILIVEDNHVFALGLETKLKMIGYKEVKIVSTVKDAKSSVEEIQPHWVILDIELKDDKNPSQKNITGGIELAKYLAADYPHIKFSFMTHLEDDKIIKMGMKTSPNHFSYKSIYHDATSIEELNNNELKNVIAQIELQCQTITIKKKVIFVHNIILIKANDDICEFILNVNSFCKDDNMLTIKFEEVNELLSCHKQFLKTHKSYIVNLDFKRKNCDYLMKRDDFFMEWKKNNYSLYDYDKGTQVDITSFENSKSYCIILDTGKGFYPVKINTKETKEKIENYTKI